MIDVADNPARSRYEVRVDDEVAGFVQYRHEDGVINLIHTQIRPDFEGRGLGGELAHGALDDIRARSARLIATCPFIRAYLRKHPEYRDLLAHS